MGSNLWKAFVLWKNLKRKAQKKYLENAMQLCDINHRISNIYLNAEAKETPKGQEYNSKWNAIKAFLNSHLKLF